MRGSVQEMWVIGMVVMFIAITLWYFMTPVIDNFLPHMDTINFNTTAVNASYHNLITYNANLWLIWPIIVCVVVFLMFFIAASDEDEFKRGRF